MKKIFFVCIASVLLFVGCSDNNDKESSSETSTTVTAAVTESSSETAENTAETEPFSGTSENTVTTETVSENPIATAADNSKTESAKIPSTANNSSDNTVQEELPIMSEKKQNPKATSVDSSVEKPKETVTTTAKKVTEPISASTTINDDVIELPFVPVR